MKVLITGATGFVGSCLTRRLVALGHDVHLLVRQEASLWRLDDILGHCAVHHLDLRDKAGVALCIGAIRPEGICHLATYGGFAEQRDTEAILFTNFLGTVHLLQACARVGFDRFINTGSSSEYGLKSVPMRESDLLEPLGDYGVAKGAATLYCRSEAVGKGLPAVTLRLFSPYGPWDDPRRLLPYLIASLLRTETPRLSTPDSVRDYIYVEDVVDLYLRLLTGPVVPGAIYNCGSGMQHSIGEVARSVSDIVGGCCQPVWGAEPQKRPEPAVWVADMSLVAGQLGWQPATPLRQGLEQTVTWMRGHLDLYR